MQAATVREGLQDIRHQIEDASLEQERAKAAGGDWLSRVEEGLAAERAVPPAAGWRALMEKAGGDMTDRELLMLSDDTFAALLGHYGFGAGPHADAILEYRARNKVDEAASPAAAATGGGADAGAEDGIGHDAREGEVRTPSASPAVAVSHASGSPAQPHYDSYHAYEAALAPLPLAPPVAGAAVAVAADTAAELAEAGSPPPPPYTPHAHEAGARAVAEVATPPVGGAKREGWLAAYLASVGATNAFSQLGHLGLGAAAAPAEDGAAGGDDAPRGGYTPSRRLYNAEELAERGRTAKQRAEIRVRTKQDKHAAAAAAAAAAADEEAAAAAAAAKRPEWDSRPALRKTGEAELEKLRMKLDARPSAEQRKRPGNAPASKTTQAATAAAAARSRSRAAAASRRSQTTVAARPALSQRSRSSRLPRHNHHHHHHHHHHHGSAGAVNLFPGCTNVCCSRFNNQRPTSAPRARVPDARRSVESVAAAASAASAAAAAAAAAASSAAYPLASYASSVPRTYTPEAYASALNAAALAGIAVPAAAPLHYAPPPPLPAVPAADEAPILSPARLDAAAASAAAAEAAAVAAAAAAAIPQAASPAAVAAAAAAAAAYSPLRCARSLEPLFLPDTAYLPVLPDISAPPPLAVYVPLTVPVGPTSPAGELAAAVAAEAEAEAATDEEPASSPYMPTDTPAEPAPHAPAPVASPDLRAAAPVVHLEDELPSPRRLDQQRSLTYDAQEFVRGASGTSEELPAPPARKLYKELCSPPVPSAAEAEAAAAAAAATAAAAEEVVAEHSRELAAGLPAAFYERALVSPCIPAELSYGADSLQQF